MAIIDTIANEIYQKYLLKNAAISTEEKKEKPNSLVKRPEVDTPATPELATSQSVVTDFIEQLSNNVYDSGVLEGARREPAVDVQMGSDRMYGRYKTPLHIFQAMNRDLDPDTGDMLVRETPSLDYLDRIDIDARTEEYYDQSDRLMVSADATFAFPTPAKPVPDLEVAIDEPSRVEDKELPSAGLGSRPVAEALTDDDMGITDIPTFGVGSRKFNSSVVDEMVSLEGMGGDDLSATPTYSYGITKEKADKYNLVPESFNTTREFADAFADKYIEEKYNANKSIFDNVDSEFHKPLMSYLWNVGSFGTNQRKALSKKNPDVREFIKEMRDAVHSEGFASSGLSARRAKEANLLGEGLANWEDIVKVEVSGTKEKPVFKWVTASGNVVEEFASGKKLHPNNKLSDVTL